MPRAKKAVGTKPAPKKAAGKSHVLAKPLPIGTKLVDFRKCEWIVGPHIGQGGFGLIYTARRATDSGDDHHVIKIEPKENGPLFCEIHFYRNVKPGEVSAWMKEKKLKTLGIPTDVSSGNHIEGSSDYRFLAMERYGQDLQKLFEQNGRRFSAVTTLIVGLKVINVLEFIHSLGYVHADIKAANLLVGLPPNENEVFLVDFGLAFRFARDGQRKPYKEDPRRRHDGTLEYCSLDAHRGVNAAPRGDFETLAFCMLEWLTGQLPWASLVGPSDADKERVFAKKEESMKDAKALVASCGVADMPDFTKFLSAIAELSYDEQINYERMRGFLESALRRLGANPKNLKLDFKTAQHSKANTKAAARKKPQANGDANIRSPAARAKSPISTAKSPAARGKSPAGRASAKSPASRAKSPAVRLKSPLLGAKSPASRAKSPLANSPVKRPTAAPKRKSSSSPGPSLQKRTKNAESQTSPHRLAELRKQRKEQKRKLI